MAEITISTSRQSCKPDCNQLNIIDQTIIMNKYSEIDESPSTDTEEPTVQEEMSASTNTMNLPLNITKMIQNKLKRKKKLSSSLTSVSDAVNQEKRTRIEGIQLNCRGKLNGELIAAVTSAPTTPTSVITQQPLQSKAERSQTKLSTPSPRVAEKIIMLQQRHQEQSSPTPLQQQQTQKVPPPKLKRKLEENVLTIQKLNAQTEQMRLEIAELKAHLGTEKSAVRVLRAQSESESRKWKNEVKKLQNAMELMRKVKKSKEEACANWTGSNSTNSCSLAANSAKDVNITNHELQRLTNEITSLKDANKNLEEKLQISNDAERRKAADLRELKDSYEIRLTQLSKSAKTEISRLLEEIKTKERNIGQLKKETNTLQKPKTNKTTKHNNNINHNKKETIPKNVAQHTSEMKKLKDIERNKNIININCNINNKNKSNNDKCYITTTCGEKEFHSMPHEFTERILEAHGDVHTYRSKQDQHQNSDSDSALSSAPPSISPQPPATGMEPADIWQTIRNYTKDIEKVQNDLESIQKENQSLQKELNLAKEQILESEKTAIEATKNLKNQQKLLDRIKQLEQKEIELQDETHELREQNELLEFRILELEESNDKWSLQSNTTPNSKNVWNNVGGKESDDAIIFTDRSDSGVTSPHSHHHIDDRVNVISPCDLNLLDHITNEDLRRRLGQMIKKPNIEEEAKMCLQQTLAIIQNIEAMSHGHDSLPSSEESSSLEYIKSRVSEYSSSSRSTDVSPTLQLQKPKSAPSSQGRIVATVLPYSSTVSTPNDSPQRKLRAWHTSSLTESGVFEGDLSETSVYTQTEPEEFACLTEPTEAQKLNRFREKFEECAKKSANAKVPVTSSQSLSPNLSDQKRLQYYKDRLEVLEGKLLIYESSGDIQAKHLADRLQREIVLENLVKELQDRVDFLEVENSEIEEEKCEFEEAENDTRLRLQRLEVELEILSQRNIELEMSREALQNKLKDCRSESAILRDDLSAVQTQVCHLEEDRCRFKENFEFLHSILPALVLFNAFYAAKHKMGNCIERNLSEPDITRHDHISRLSDSCDCAEGEDVLKKEISNLRGEIRSLKRQINDLNSRHSEAMACADGCWEDLEKSYNDRLMASKSKEESLQKKIKQLEDCLQDDSRAANEKICQLEDAERELRMCLQKVSRDQRQTLQEHGLITEEYHRLKEKYEKLVEQVDGPIKDALEREKNQNKNLKDELGYIRRINCEQEMHYRNELDCFEVQLDKLQKELLQIQVTNSELREEVCTLEKEVMGLHQTKKEDLDKIRCLSDEVRTKEEMCDILEKRMEKLLNGPYFRQRQAQVSDRIMSASFSGAVPSLAQELNGSPVKRIKIEEPVDLKTATKNLGTVLGSIKDSARMIPSHRQFQNVANDVKKLAESLLANKSELLRVLEETLNSRLLQFHSRSGATQNDSNRDYSNLSHEPNIEAPAGHRQQPIGHRQTFQAKDKYDDDDEGDNKSKERLSLENYYSPRNSCPCLNPDNVSLSTDCKRHQGSHVSSIYGLDRFYPNCRDKPHGSGTIKKPALDYPLPSYSQNSMTSRKIEDQTQYKACSCSKMVIDSMTKPDYECLCDRNSCSMSLIVNVCDKSDTSQESTTKKHTQSVNNENTNSEAFSITCSIEEQKQASGLCSQHLERQNGLLTKTSNSIEHPELSMDCSENRGKFEKERFKREHLNKSVGTSITPRQSLDEEVIPLLKSIYDVLQSMKSEHIQLSSPITKTIKYQLQEPLKILPPTPTPSSLYSQQRQQISPISPIKVDKSLAKDSNLCPGFSKENANSFSDSEYGMQVLEPPERDTDDYKNYQQDTTTSQRVIPVDMDLLRTDEEFNWEPDPKFDKAENKVDELTSSSSFGSHHSSLDDVVPLKAQFLQLTRESKVNFSRGNSFHQNTSKDSKQSSQDDIEISHQQSCNKNSELTSQIRHSCDCLSEATEKCADDCSRNAFVIENNSKDQTDPIVLQNLNLQTHKHDRKDENDQTELRIQVDQEVQVHDVSLMNMASRSVQFKSLESQTDELSEEKFLKISRIDKSKEELSPIFTPQDDITPVLIDTDNPDLSNEDDNLIKSCTVSCQCQEDLTNPQNEEMSHFIESILYDLKAMQKIRERSSLCQRSTGLSLSRDGPNRDLSFPVTIETVQELGKNSLFVKWKVRNIANIGGYEIFLDGLLTNRYFNCIHRAAVICDVNLQTPHRITLRAKPLIPSKTSFIPTNTKVLTCSAGGIKEIPSNASHPEASCPQPDGSIWYPSVYHFEPNSYLAPTNAVLY